MAESKRIFVTTDFSPCADYAVGYAVALAKRLGASVVLGHVVDSSYLTYAALYGQQIVADPDVRSVEESAKAHLAQAVEKIKNAGVDATADFARGAPIAELVRMISASGAVLTVVGTHGHTGFDKFLFGSTCEKLLRQSPVPVLAIKQPDADAQFNPENFAIARVACTTDLSDLSRSVLPFAAELCAALDAQLTVLHVIDARYAAMPYAAVETPTREHLQHRAESVLREWTQWLKAPQIESRILHGVPSQVIADYVRDNNIDLLIMATHGHSGLAHALLGSTTERTLRITRCPILAIRPN